MNILQENKQVCGPHEINVYQLSTQNTGRIAVTCLPKCATQEYKASVVMQSGMFSNRRFWLSKKGIGLAAYLSKLGYECWMMDRRGTGSSAYAGKHDPTLYETIEHDIPAVQTLIESVGRKEAIYMGHSFGGVLNSISVAKGHLKNDGVKGLVNFSSQLTVGKRFLNKPYSAVIYGLTGILGYFPSKALKMGPENESKQVMRDCCRIVEQAKGKSDFWSGFEAIRCPVLAFGSDGDRVDPMLGCEAFIKPMLNSKKLFVRLGRQYGHKQDYDHVGMVVSKDAQGEVWPMVSSWLDALS